MQNNDIPTFEQMFQMLTAIQREREALGEERRLTAMEVEKMKMMFDKLSIQDQLQMLTREKIEFYLEQKVKEADLQFRQQSHALDVKVFDASKKFELMKMALEEMKFEFVQMVQQKFGTLDKREIELQTKDNALLHREMLLQMQAKDNEMKSMVASIANTNEAHKLDMLQNQLTFKKQVRKTILEDVKKSGHKTLDDYMKNVWGFDDTRYLPHGN